MAEKMWKKRGLYEELKSENNPEIINQKVKAKMLAMSKEELQKAGEKSLKLPALLDELEKKFPWYLRYYWVILLVISGVVCGIGLVIGYLLEPEEKIN